MFPIDIMPPAIYAVMRWLPFYYELFFPVAIFLGRFKGVELAQGLAIQTGWLLLTWMWARFMWQRGLGHYQAGSAGSCGQLFRSLDCYISFAVEQLSLRLRLAEAPMTLRKHRLAKAAAE
jgi:hypothetical protein